MDYNILYVYSAYRGRAYLRAGAGATSANNHSNAWRINSIISDDWLIGAWYAA